YNSLTNDLHAWVFESTTGGASWSAAIPAFGGDKQWMTLDRDLDNAYEAWSIVSNPYAPNTFDKSIDDAATWNNPSELPFSPIWRTLATAPDHTLYVGGWATDGIGSFTGELRIDRSTDAQDHVVTAPTFTGALADLGGFLNTGGPNPVGLLGQLWIATDRS